MKEKDLKDFAGTKHDGLPEKVKKEEPEVSSPLVESLVESAAQRMVAKARRETALQKRLNRQGSSAQQRVGVKRKKVKPSETKKPTSGSQRKSKSDLFLMRK